MHSSPCICECLLVIVLLLNADKIYYTLFGDNISVTEVNINLTGQLTNISLIFFCEMFSKVKITKQTNKLLVLGC